MKISVIIPVFNEEEALKFVISEALSVLNDIKKEFEIVIIDDGSTDNTNQISVELSKLHREVKVVRHVKNYGKDAALWSGFDNSDGDVIVMIDGDGQNDFRDIPRLLPLLQDYDAIFGQRVKRMDNFAKRLVSLFAYSLRSLVLGDKVKDTGCALKIIKRKTLRHLLPINGMHRFISFLFNEEKVPFIEVPVNHRQRQGGESKFSILKFYFLGPTIDFLFMWWFKIRRQDIKKAKVLIYEQHT